jgi:hypothetical protein
VPHADDFIVKGSAGADDKFINSNLEQGLKDKGIKRDRDRYLGAGCGRRNRPERGYMAVVPVDGTSSEDTYNEQYAALRHV